MRRVFSVTAVTYVTFDDDHLPADLHRHSDYKRVAVEAWYASQRGDQYIDEITDTDNGEPIKLHKRVEFQTEDFDMDVVQTGEWYACPACQKRMEYQGEFGAPGRGQSWKCVGGHPWAKVGGSFYHLEDGMHIMTEEDVI